MMPKPGSAGYYQTRFEWRQRALGTPDAFGEKPGARKSRAVNSGYPSQGDVWGAIEDLSPNRATEKESERQEMTATIHVRNYPAVAPGDQLIERGLGFVWTITTAVRGDNETVCEVWR